MRDPLSRVLLDTDIGSDIDDAVCLAYLLGQPRCDLLGITTVTGQASLRAELASVLCRHAGRDIPIYPGAEQPLLTEQRQPRATQAEALGSWDRQTGFPSGEAVGFLRDTIRRYPGQIDLLTIGPLTNIGILFALDPEIPSLLKSLVMMCGKFGPGPPEGTDREWNASGDPYATAIVYRHAVPVHRSIGLNVTRRVTMDVEEVRRRFRAPLLVPVLDFADVWFRDQDRITFHDPLAAVTLFDDEVCRFERGTVGVQLDPPERRGTTHWEQTSGRHEVAVSVDPARFFHEFFSVLDYEGGPRSER